MDKQTLQHAARFESELLPDYLVEGLITKDEKENKTADAVDIVKDIWTKMDIGSIPVIVRLAALRRR